MNKLKQTRLTLEKMVYEKGINVALAQAELTDTYASFVKDIRTGILHQITHCSDLQTLQTLLYSTKAKAPEKLVIAVSLALSDDDMGNHVDFVSYLLWAGEQGGQAALDKLGIDATFGIENQGVINYFNDYEKLLINNVDNTTKQWIANRIQEGKNLGLTPEEIASSLVDEGKNISKARARAIALTETARAMVYVEVMAAKRWGIKEKIWRTSRDEKVDEICKELEGKQTTIDGMFPGGYEDPPAHTNCRCFIEEVVPDSWELPAHLWLGE